MFPYDSKDDKGFVVFLSCFSLFLSSLSYSFMVTDTWIVSSSPSIWHWLMWALDCFTSPSVGIIMALMTIGVFHYKAVWMNFLADVVEHGIQETLLDCFLNLCDLMRAYYQIVCEVIRNILAASGWSGGGSGAVGVPSTGSSYLNHTMTAPTTTDTRSSNRNSTPPPLIIVPNFAEESKLPIGHAGDSPKKNGRVTMMKQPQLQQQQQQPPFVGADSFQSTGQCDGFAVDEIEPAFLDERDYPKGWLLYHPTLGVISKEEADQYNHRQVLSHGP